MGVRHTKEFGAEKSTTTTGTPLTTAVSAPAADSIAIVMMVVAANQGRKLEVLERIRICQEYIKNNNVLDGTSANVNVMVTLAGDKRDVAIVATDAEIVDGMIGIQVSAEVRAKGKHVTTDTTIKELIDFAIENGRITV